MKELVIKITATVIAVTILLTFVVGVHVNHSVSMAPAMRDGDLVITNRLGSLYADSVVWYNGKFGRIVGVPGDTIYIDENKFTVNGNVLQEIIYYETLPGEGITYPYTVPENSYFILNDFRDDTQDSRTYGAIPKSEIEGTVCLELRRRGF